MAYATATDIENRLGRTLDAAETQIVSARLDDVEELIFHRIPDLAEKVAAGTIRQRLVVMVECEAVMRLIRNPEGYTQETDGNYSYVVDATVASGRLTILPEEWAMLGVSQSVTVITPRVLYPAGMWRLNPNWSFESGPDAALWAYATSVECPDEDGDDLDTAVWA